MPRETSYIADILYIVCMHMWIIREVYDICKTPSPLLLSLRYSNGRITVIPAFEL